MLSSEYPTVKYIITRKALFLCFNFCLKVQLISLSCSFIPPSLLLDEKVLKK